MKRMILTFCLIFTLFSCGGSSETSDNKDQAAQNYLSEILRIMRANVVTRNEVDWGELELQVNEIAKNARSIQQTIPAITKALELINTNHSFLTSASGAFLAGYSELSCVELFDMSVPPIDNIGYVRVDGFSPTNASSTLDFATNIQASIRQQDTAGLSGWIVDLRDNTGGNMWPMIAGLGPLFSTDTLGHFIDPNENITAWGYESGSSLLDGNNIVTVADPYVLLNPLAKIAVLSSRRAGSSGEATLIAFKKQFNVRFFGTDSCGLSTANTSFNLSDGSVLYLTTAIIADREQQKYGEKVPVDEAVAQENVVERAIGWINGT